MVEYAAFYDYIKEVLCINKDTPALDCKGTCYLKKQLSKASDSQNNKESNHSSVTENTIVFFQDIFSKSLFAFSIEQYPKLNAAYNKLYKFHYTHFIFHPPIA